MSGILRTTVLAGLAAATALTAPALADKPGDTDTTKTSSKGPQVRNCDGGTVSLAGPTILWPPNHKMVDQQGKAVSTGTASPTGGETTLTLNAAKVDDVAGGDGKPGELDSSALSTRTDSQDGTSDRTANVPYEVRAERSGKGEGRTYVIHWTAKFDDGSMCSSKEGGTGDEAPFTVSVPHDQGRNS